MQCTVSRTQPFNFHVSNKDGRSPSVFVQLSLSALSTKVAPYCSPKLDWLQIRNRNTLHVNGGTVRNLDHVGRGTHSLCSCAYYNVPAALREFFSLLSSREIWTIRCEELDHTVFNPTNCTCNHKQLSVILLCSCYMLRTLQAIFRAFMCKGRRLFFLSKICI